MQFLYPIGLREAAEGAGLHQGGIRFVEVFREVGGQRAGRGLFLSPGEGECRAVAAVFRQVGAGDGHVFRACRPVPLQHQQQFLAFIVHGHHVGFADVAQGVQGQSQVQHGREFQQDVRGLLQQAVFQL